MGYRKRNFGIPTVRPTENRPYFATCLRHRHPPTRGYQGLLIIKEMVNNEYMTSADAAKFLGITTCYLQTLTRQKRIPFYRPFGNRFFYSRQELTEMMEEHRTPKRERTARTARKQG